MVNCSVVGLTTASDVLSEAICKSTLPVGCESNTIVKVSWVDGSEVDTVALLTVKPAESSSKKVPVPMSAVVDIEYEVPLVSWTVTTSSPSSIKFGMEDTRISFEVSPIRKSKVATPGVLPPVTE